MSSAWSWRGLLAVAACGCVVAAGASPAPAAEQAAGRLVPCKEPGWPQWRGPRRDGVSDETGLLASWPAGEPKRLWTASPIGKGYSSPVFGGGRAYITGDVGEQLRIFALSPDGKVVWQAANGKSWKKPFGGARAACCFDEGRLYNMNAYGRVACLDAATGEEIWAVEALKRFAAKQPYFGVAECLMVDGPRLIVSPGGKKGLLAALDKRTGKTVWASDAVAADDETAGYSSPILIELGGRRQVVATSSANTVAADAETGKVLWKFPLNWSKQSTSTIPVFRGDSVFITNATRTTCALYRLQIAPDNASAKKAWSIELANGHGSLLCVGGRIYGADGKKAPGWDCIDADSGKVLYAKSDLPVGSLMAAEGLLYCLSEKGTMALLKPTGSAFETVGQFELVKGKKDVWAHPVVRDGRLYLRYQEQLHCYDVRSSEGK